MLVLEVSEVMIRRGAAADAVFLPDIERSAAHAFQGLPNLGWTPGNFVTSEKEHLVSIGRATLWVAEEMGIVVGFLTADIKDEELHIDEFNMRFDRQHRGIGRRLISAALEHARAAGLKAVTLTTFRDVPWNGPFYGGTGFDFVEEEQLGPRLKAILDSEAVHGLPREKRCAMRLTVHG
jgi:ribosomal protein S18 acetylase RimI-like enzyme